MRERIPNSQTKLLLNKMRAMEIILMHSEDAEQLVINSDNTNSLFLLVLSISA